MFQAPLSSDRASIDDAEDLLTVPTRWSLSYIREIRTRLLCIAKQAIKAIGWLSRLNWLKHVTKILTISCSTRKASQWWYLSYQPHEHKPMKMDFFRSIIYFRSSGLLLRLKKAILQNTQFGSKKWSVVKICDLWQRHKITQSLLRSLT